MLALHLMPKGFCRCWWCWNSTEPWYSEAEMLRHGSCEVKSVLISAGEGPVFEWASLHSLWRIPSQGLYGLPWDHASTRDLLDKCLVYPCVQTPRFFFNLGNFLTSLKQWLSTWWWRRRMSLYFIHHKPPSPTFVSSRRTCHSGFRKIFGVRERDWC